MSPEKKESFFKRKPKTALAIIAGIMLLCLEVFLRWLLPTLGYQVGNTAPYWQPIPQVDELVVTPEFYTDSFGIYRAISEVWTPRGDEINSIGFRSREFKEPSDSNQIKILHIGDSFTWGSNADPRNNCYVDLIDQYSKYVCYNTGIPGADPVQYELIAKRVIPQLRPQVVIVHFFMGNDIMIADRKPKPFKDLYYQSNVGWLPGFYNGTYFDSAEESYNFIRDKHLPSNWLTKVIYKTALGTTLFSIPVRIQEQIEWRQSKTNSISQKHLESIAATCKKYNTQLIISLIPNPDSDLTSSFTKDAKASILQEYPNAFKGLESFLLVLPMKPEHYHPQPDGHFNNEGHAFAAEAILKRVEGD